MSQGDQFHQYGYDHYLKAPSRESSHRNSRGSYMNYGGNNIVSSLFHFPVAVFRMFASLVRSQNPVVAGGVLLGAVALLLGVVIFSFSSGDGGGEPIPIIKAEMGDIKYVPNDAGGMDIQNRQSTILAREDQPSAEDQAKMVENLLASKAHEDLISREEAFDRETQKPVLGDIGDIGNTDNVGDIGNDGGNGGASSVSFSDSAEAQDDLAALNAQASGAVDVSYGSDVAAGASAFELEKPTASDILQKIGSTREENEEKDDVVRYSRAFVNMTAKAAMVEKPMISRKIGAALSSEKSGVAVAGAAMRSKPAYSKLHGAGQSPETLEYVRSVLGSRSYDSGGVRNNSGIRVHKGIHDGFRNARNAGVAGYAKNVNSGSVGRNSGSVGRNSGSVGRSNSVGRSGDAARVSRIEPASGTVAESEISPRVALSSGAYFVQLASITDARRAPEEWLKMQNKYSVLEDSRFRVQEATLPGGTFYRIQAGPMSKSSATQICDILKQAGKPGGCLVVK